MKLLTVIDEMMDECLAVEVGQSFTHYEVIDVLHHRFAVDPIGSGPMLRVATRSLQFVVRSLRC